MNIKRYFAPDIRQAIRMVREEQGADAVILSNRKVDGGVEIVAARDFDERFLDNGKAEAPEQPPETGRRDAQRRAEDVFRETRDGIPAIEESETQPSPRAPAPRLAPPRGPSTDSGAARPRPSAESVPPRRPAPNQERLPAARPAPRDAAPRPAKPESRPLPRAVSAEAAPARQPGGQAAALREALREREAQPERGTAVDAAGEPDLRHLQRELQQMRRLLDEHFAHGGSQQPARARPPMRLDLLRRLAAAGFSKRLSLRLAERVGMFEDFEPALDRARGLIARDIPAVEHDLLEHGGVVALVGPTGVGKTTTIAKLAARFRLEHGPRQVALITTDNYRIAAHEQLSTYGRILDVPVRVASSTEELRQLVAGFYDRRLVLIDTAGMGQRDERLAEQAALFADTELAIQSYLVLSAASQARVIEEAMEAFQAFSPEACILTKLDETVQLGSAISSVIERRMPLAYLCDGQQVPEDLHPAGSQLILERCFAESTDAGDTEALPLDEDDWVAHAHF